MIIGALWAAWHLPVLFGHNLLSIIVFLLAAFLLSFIFTWLFNGSGQSLIPVLLFHAAQNPEEMFETLFPALIGSDWELISTLGFASPWHCHRCLSLACKHRLPLTPPLLILNGVFRIYTTR